MDLLLKQPVCVLGTNKECKAAGPAYPLFYVVMFRFFKKIKILRCNFVLSVD